MHKTYSKDCPGRPPNHPKIMNLETGEVFYTFTDAAYSVNGDRKNVSRVCYGVQSHHKGYHFIFLPEDE